MRSPAPRLGLLALAALILVAPACSSQAPPAPEPRQQVAQRTPEPAPTPAPTPAPAAGEWEQAEAAPETFLSADEINARDLLKAVYFDYDRAEIRPDQRATLQANAAWLRDNPGVRILVEGHADERGTREYNLALGDRRAQAARDYLVSLGVTAARVETISYGEERPAASGESEQSWSQNRRSEFVAVGNSGSDN